MPRIMELRVVDEELWAKIGRPEDFPSGVSLWTPEEQIQADKDAIKAYIYTQKLTNP
jgi:hypothetical protein